MNQDDYSTEGSTIVEVSTNVDISEINDEYIDEYLDEDVYISKLQLLIIDDLNNNIDLSKFKTKYVETMIKNTVGIHCKNCHSDNVHVYTKQTRSADEASTKFYTCLNCGNKWSVN